MIIEIPKELVPLRAINFSKYLYNCESDDDFYYDFKHMQHCHPFGLLVVASAIRENMKRYPNAKHVAINTEQTQGCEFAASFGFFSSIGFDIGEWKEEIATGNGYIPIKAISKEELHNKYSDTTSLNEKIVRHASELADMLVQYKSKEVKDALQYCFREIMRNTFEHAETDKIWVCGQYWPTREEAEIAILDEGIGIFKSLSSNKKINVVTDKDANCLALQPGLSCTFGLKQDKYNIWQNSGYGLYVASTLCAMCGGYFLIDSGNSCILVNKRQGQVDYESYHQGTAVCMNIKTASKQLRNFSRTLNIIVAEGEQKAKENGQNRIVSASKVTTIASMIRHIEDAVREQSVYEVVSAESNGNNLIPLNTLVLFKPISVNARGEILGVFEYQGQNFEGVLLNVDSINRKLYVDRKVTLTVVVRKVKDGKYTLLEQHKYNKLCKKSKSKS